MDIRDAEATEIDQLAAIWYDGWHEAHAPVLPAELTALRTRESLVERIAHALPRVRVAGPPGAPVGFSIIQGSELYQLYVAPQGRGGGVASALLADAEMRLTAAGVQTAWLSCANGNDRAARFYEKSGWRRAGTMTYETETSKGPFPLEVWRYEKQLTGGAGSPAQAGGPAPQRSTPA